MIVYDGLGIRIRKCAPNCGSPASSTIYIFSGSKVIAEYDNGAAVASPSREYIYSGAQLLAKSESGALTYYHSDHLSNRATTDSSGNVLAQRAHYPFGETWYESGAASKLKFTTYERDSETGDDFAMARYAVSGLGRFSSPDALAGSALAPQSMNRFSYVQNDPINSADPSGLVRTPWGFAFSDVGFGSSWNEFDLIPVYGYSFQMVPWSSSTGEPVTTEEWSYGIVGYMQDPFGPGELPGGVPLDPGPLAGPQKQPPPPRDIPIGNALQRLMDALAKDPDCLKFLGSHNIYGMQMLTAIYEYGSYGQDTVLPTVRDGKLTMNNAITNGPSYAITVNSLGAFYNSSYQEMPLTTDRGRIPGGTPAAQGFILLHELGHNTNALSPDANNQSAIDQNDLSLEKNCSKTISALKH